MINEDRFDASLVDPSLGRANFDQAQAEALDLLRSARRCLYVVCDRDGGDLQVVSYCSYPSRDAWLGPRFFRQIARHAGTLARLTARRLRQASTGGPGE